MHACMQSALTLVSAAASLVVPENIEAEARKALHAVLGAADSVLNVAKVLAVLGEGCKEGCECDGMRCVSGVGDAPCRSGGTCGSGSSRACSCSRDWGTWTTRVHREQVWRGVQSHTPRVQRDPPVRSCPDLCEGVSAKGVQRATRCGSREKERDKVSERERERERVWFPCPARRSQRRRMKRGRLEEAGQPASMHARARTLKGRAQKVQHGKRQQGMLIT